MAEGLPDREISDRLFIAERTVRFHLTSVFGKLGAHNRTQAVRLAEQRHLLRRGARALFRVPVDFDGPWRRAENRLFLRCSVASPVDTLAAWTNFRHRSRPELRPRIALPRTTALHQEYAPLLRSLRVEVVGISTDGFWSHRAFAREAGIRFPLLADSHPTGAVSRACGAHRGHEGSNARALFVVDGLGLVLWSRAYIEDATPRQADDGRSA